MSGAGANAALIAAQAANAQTQALATITAALIAALVGTIGAAFITSRIQAKRNLQDRESQWRQHAVELTKLEVDRQLRSRGPRYEGRPAILDFLAFYRDLQELNSMTPRDLYVKIKHGRINSAPNRPTVAPPSEALCIVSCGGDGEEGHQLVYLALQPGKTTSCPYCSQKFVRAWPSGSTPAAASRPVKNPG